MISGRGGGKPHPRGRRFYHRPGALRPSQCPLGPLEGRCAPAGGRRGEGAPMAERGQGRAYGLWRNTMSWARACPRSGDVPPGGQRTPGRRPRDSRRRVPRSGMRLSCGSGSGWKRGSGRAARAEIDGPHAHCPPRVRKVPFGRPGGQMNGPHAHFVRCPPRGTAPERGQARAHDTAFRKKPWARPWPRSAMGAPSRCPRSPKHTRGRAVPFGRPGGHFRPITSSRGFSD